MTPDTRSAASRNAAWQLAIVFLVVMGLAVAKKTGLVDYDVAKRGVAIALGALLVGAGNLLPKFRLFEGFGYHAPALWAERASGWVLVMAGVAYVSIWAVAPIMTAMWLSSVVGLCAFAGVGAIWLRMRQQAASAGSSAAREPVGRQLALAGLLVTFLWCAAAFLIDYLWGDTVVQWASIVYVVAFGVVFGVLVPRRLAEEQTAPTSGD